MKRLVLLLGISLVAVSAGQSQLRDDSCNVFSGTLGTSTRIGISLSVKGKTIEAAYFYRNYLKDIALKGSATGARDILLVETDIAGATKGRFHPHLAEHDPHYSSAEVLQGEVLQGTWTGSDGAKTYPVTLRMEHSCAKPGTPEYEIAEAEDDALVERNVQAFYAAVLGGKREEVAKYVSCPCTFIQDGKRISIRNAAEFLKNYDTIFTKQFVARIASVVPHHMFANDQGIMIADGAVWFSEEGKARNFNNSPTT
jgi:hypothetical protein